MSHSTSHIEVGSFWIVHRGTGQTVLLYPDSALIGEAISPYPTDERQRRADERAAQLEKMLMTGAVASRAELAARMGISRARITQILNRLQGPRAVRSKRNSSAGPAHHPASDRAALGNGGSNA